MFITTTLGGIALAIAAGCAVGAVAGAMVRPRIDRACKNAGDFAQSLKERAKAAVRERQGGR